MKTYPFLLSLLISAIILITNNSQFETNSIMVSLDKVENINVEPNHKNHIAASISVNSQTKQATNKKSVAATIISSHDLETENRAADKNLSFMVPAKPAHYEIRKETQKKIQISQALAKVGYWDTVYSIESKQGKRLYRPRNKSRNCTYTTAPCGHHQLTVKALKDIGCMTLQCRKDRLDYTKSLQMSKKLLAINEKRLKKNGYENLEDYQRYLIHQQGATGVKVILAATRGERLLSKNIKRNMANNSPYSYKQLDRKGSRLAAIVFMSHWKRRWEKEKYLVAGINLA